jgi:hypothetical protein
VCPLWCLRTRGRHHLFPPEMGHHFFLGRIELDIQLRFSWRATWTEKINEDWSLERTNGLCPRVRRDQRRHTSFSRLKGLVPPPPRYAP